MSDNRALTALIDALRHLPGVGAKSAARMAFHLLQHDRAGGLELATALRVAMEHVQHCRLCHTFTEDEICTTCLDPIRDRTQLCVVETPADQAALERTGAYKGLYFVLMGKLNPLSGVGVGDIGLAPLLTRVGGGEWHQQLYPPVEELILATNFTAAGETTAYVVGQAFKGSPVKVTRISQGVPVGSELEYVDLGTIAHALVDRRLAG